MSEDAMTVLLTGDRNHGSRCLVYGIRICMEYWGPCSHYAIALGVQAEGLEEAHLERGMVTVIGYHMLRWDASKPELGWNYVADQQPCEVPLAALTHIFGETLPPHLQSLPADR